MLGDVARSMSPTVASTPDRWTLARASPGSRWVTDSPIGYVIGHYGIAVATTPRDCRRPNSTKCRAPSASAGSWIGGAAGDRSGNPPARGGSRELRHLLEHLVEPLRQVVGLERRTVTTTSAPSLNDRGAEVVNDGRPLPRPHSSVRSSVPQWTESKPAICAVSPDRFRHAAHATARSRRRRSCARSYNACRRVAPADALQRQRHPRRDARPLVQQPRERLSRAAQLLRRLGHRPPLRRQRVPEALARVRRISRWSLGATTMR